MSNALDNLVADVDRLVSEMGSNLPLHSDETTRSWCASISAQFLAFNRRLRDAIKEERTSRQELEAFSLFEKYAETPDDKLNDSGLALKHKLLRLGSSSAQQNHGRFQTFDSARRAYMFETGETVYDKESYEKFGKWLYSKKCDDSCPYYRIVEGEGDARPRCTNPCGTCVSEDKEETSRVEKAQKKITLDNNGDIVIALDFNDARWIANRLEELSRTGCSANMSQKLTSMARRLRKKCDSLEICCNCKTWLREGKTCVGTCPHADGMTAEWMWGCPNFSKKTHKRS